MRAELPWNVAGIPPEAREAARAAARREGLSVGEWLTRRILRSFSDQGEDAASSYDRSFERGQPLDSWGLPQSSAARRDTEDMLNRVSRSEAEASDAFRRIEEHLRTVTRRLDSAERTQSENNRTVSKTATEMNIASREQAQAFDQLGNHVVAINDRLERLERNATQDGLKDAVKALHQGLSRVADQISHNATQSAQQVTAISGNLEQMANRLGQVRSDVEAVSNRLEARISQIQDEYRGHFSRIEEETKSRISKIEEENQSRFSKIEEETTGRIAKIEEENRSRLSHIQEETKERIAAFETETQRGLDQRLAAVEKAAQYNTNALDHALERLEAQTETRAGDQVELQKHHAEIGGAISRIEETLEKLEAQPADPQVDKRLDSLERALSSLVNRLESYDPTAPLEDTLRGMSHRIDAVEKNHGELKDELRANLAAGAGPASVRTEPPFDPAIFENKKFDHKSFDQSFDPKSFDDEFFAPDRVFEAPPVAEPAPPFDDASSFPDEPPPAGEADPFAADPFAADSFETGAFTPLGEDAAQIAADENFLAAARRSAQAAAEAENARSGGFNFFASKDADGEPKERSKLTVPLIVGIVLVLALFAGVMFSQRLKSSHPAPAPKPAQAAKNNAPSAPPVPAPAPQETAQLPAAAPAEKPAAPSTGSQPNAPAAPVGPAPEAKAQPLQLFAPAPKAGSPVPTLDRVTQLANSGNATAQTILGLKELDGDGVPANPTDAAKWLERAAQQGQAVAQYRLGAAYERGQGVTANPATAVRWYQLSANQGNRKAMHNLAVAYASGAAGKKDMAEAARWFSKAAELGLADSQFNLAVLYERGDGAPQSLLDAYKWYAIAAAQGDAESKTRLSVISTQLSDDDRSAAQKSAASFHAAALNRAANVPPEMADLSGK
jgi:localization factor PodJL